MFVFTNDWNLELKWIHMDLVSPEYVQIIEVSRNYICIFQENLYSVIGNKCTNFEKYISYSIENKCCKLQIIYNNKIKYRKLLLISLPLKGDSENFPSIHKSLEKICIWK